MFRPDPVLFPIAVDEGQQTCDGFIMDAQAATDELWRTKPDVIRRFLQSRPLYEKLSEEVAFILEAAITKAGIEFAAVTHRAKTLESFCEKAARKKYPDPIREITDFSGVRIVYLYKSDRKRLETLIGRQFKIIEKIDTIDIGDTEKFGYGALHYLISLARGTSGARYDELKDQICEIQVRTILQDGWAVIAHHLSYKQEADVPAELRRKLGALSGLFETADDQFDRVREERLKYAARLKKKIEVDAQEFLDAPLNLDNLIEYLSWKFPSRKKADRDTIAGLLEEVRTGGYQTLREFDSAVDRAIKAVEAFEKKHPPLNTKTHQSGKLAAVGMARVAFYFVNKEQRGKKVGKELQQQYEKLEHLVEDKA